MGKQKASPPAAVAVTPPPAVEQTLDHEEPRGRRVMVARSVFSGPMPPPELVREYELILPGAAKYFFSALEFQAVHRHEMERKALDASIRNETVGMWLAFVLAVIVIAAGTFLIHEGKDPQGLSLIVGTMVSLCAVFAYSRTKTRREAGESRAGGAQAGG